ncbi:MAG: NUDIX domain-containing protein [Candidatus Methanofastidiosa archaeon]|nr:NUDIX domain-containing protein [Candidatus Methanofastidiosa archaeon]
MGIQSAGILLFRHGEKGLQVMLVHPGGPFWARKDAGSWSIPKGLIEEGENLLDAAKREFKEETGFAVDGDFIKLGELEQPSKKVVHAWALEGDLEESKVKSNTFSLEWPKGSGNLSEFPEVDKACWFDAKEAKKKILRGQASFIEKLEKILIHKAEEKRFDDKFKQTRLI